MMMDLQYGDHAGHLYQDFDERVAAGAAFFKEGLARGDRCVWFVEESAQARVRDALTAALEPKPERAESLLVLTGWYRGEDHPHAQEHRLEELRTQALAEGFKGLRLLIDTGWALQVKPALLTGREGLGGQWCARQRDAIVVCEYDAAAVPSEFLHAALRTHSHIILKGQVVPNPYCEPAELTIDAETAGRRVQWMLERLRSIAKDAAQRREREQRALFLAEACMVLGSSLDLSTIFNQVAKLAVPLLCDLCVIDIVEENGEVRRVAVASRNPDLAAGINEQYRREWATPGTFPILKRVLASGRAEMEPEVSAEFHAKTWSEPRYSGLTSRFPWRSFMMVPLMVRGRVRGAISFHISESPRRYNLSDLAFAESLARAAALALDNARLYGRAQQSAANRERLQMAGELHDMLSQSLFSIGLKIDWCLHKLTARSKARARLEEVRADIGQMIGQVRGLIAQTTPERRSTSPLAARIRALVGEFRKLTEASVTLELDDEVGLLNPSRRQILYRALREALTNVAKHARASHVAINLRRNGAEITFEVIDDGVGIPRSAVRPDLLGRPSHFGLRHMTAEFAREGGRLQVSSAGDRGFRLAGALPLDSAEGQ